ncbi:MAG: hypothetical protein RJA70_598 [Pseudomonadota bacterium]|jgi:hypothetical protein
MTTKKTQKTSPLATLTRRSALRLGLSAVAAAPTLWIPKPLYAQQCTGRGGVKHLMYIRLSGGFRFTTAFNGAVASEFNPFGVASDVAAGTEWGPSKLLDGAPWLAGDMGTQLKNLGMRKVTSFSNEIAVLATVDHEPFAGGADGNHGTGLERYLTGYVGGENSLFTMMHYGVRDRIAAAAAEGRIELPPFVLGSTGMAKGNGKYAAYRPPLVQGDNFEDFAFSSLDKVPAWALKMAEDSDKGMRDRQMLPSQSVVDAYMGTRESTRKFADIFNSEALRINNNSDEEIDGISNRRLATMFGEDGAARRARLALRLFKFGAPAVYFDQGGYDMHSGEETGLPGGINELNRLLSALNASLKVMQHPMGGTYWDHTLVVLGSEFGRTTRGNKFNSAKGSDHGGDRATRWMSMPMMGGVIDKLGMAGKQYGHTANSDLKDDGLVFSYRSVAKTLMDLLCADHSEFFPADDPLMNIF